MADPTRAECFAQMAIVVDWLQELSELASVDATNLIGLEDSFVAALEGEYLAKALEHLRQRRTRVSSVLSNQAIRQLLAPFEFELSRAINKPATTLATASFELRRFMSENTETVKSRNLTFATPAAAGGNVGNGAVTRYTVDRYGNNLETIHLEAKRIECVADQGSRPKGQETFLFTGEERERDNLKVLGSGSRTPISAINAQLSDKYVSNSSFDRHTATVDNTSPTTLTDWTVAGAIGNLKMRSSAALVYRESQKGLTPWSLQFDASDTISQVLRDKRNPTFQTGIPYHFQVAVMRRASATGTVTLHMGTKSQAVNLATLTNDVWSILKIGPGTMNYFHNFREDDLDVKIVVATLATGQVIVDDMLMWPATMLDGSFAFLTGGDTPFAVEDTFTYTDALASTDSKIQYWRFRAGLPALPATTGTPTYADP